MSPKLRQGTDIPGQSFGQELTSTIKAVNDRQIQADQAMATAAVDGPNKIHETMIQLEEADLSSRLLLKVRSKALDAYQEIMRMSF
ncbi:MAG TPA: flagellar hook-basal body complex protein FliE [Syntrophobacteraceae bacterium]|nr:flagellar hook-basal body complex protein FliE [Syntrophobacteraceae bacterium]HBZ54378.1 flagellar hook-basal body complex protein FliE [Syntrophobacteraceae bacterium]